MDSKRSFFLLLHPNPEQAWATADNVCLESDFGA